MHKLNGPTIDERPIQAGGIRLPHRIVLQFQVRRDRRGPLEGLLASNISRPFAVKGSFSEVHSDSGFGNCVRPGVNQTPLKSAFAACCALNFGADESAARMSPILRPQKHFVVMARSYSGRMGVNGTSFPFTQTFPFVFSPSAGLTKEGCTSNVTSSPALKVFLVMPVITS